MLVIETLANHPDDRVLGALGQPLAFLDIRVLQGGEELFPSTDIPFAALTPPPESAFTDHGHRRQGASENRPHHGAAFEEELKYDIA